jgi:hypothetical protein
VKGRPKTVKRGLLEERVTLLITLISKISLGDFLMHSFYLFFFGFSKG